MYRLLKLKDRIIAKVFKILTLDFIFPHVYKKAAKKPVDPNKVIFIEVRLANVSNSFKVIFDELVSNYNYTVHTHFLRNNVERRHIYMKRCIDMLKDMATAKYVFMNEASNCVGSVKLRPETKITQLWHGCGAFKKFGLSTADLIFGDTREEQLRHPYYKTYSLVTVSSPEVAWAYEEAMNLSDRKEIIKGTGSSRTDVFYDKDFIDTAYETLYDIVPQAKGKKVILYAPTFRGRVARAQTSHMLNIKMFYEAFKDEYVLLFKHHPLARRHPEIPSEYADFAMNVTEIMDIEDLLCVSDICITDYSSLVFEYSLFEKPIIFFAYDLDTYFDWRGFYYDYYEMSPGPVCTTNLEMIDYIKNLDTQFDKQRVKDFRFKFMRSCDGHSTQRILEEMMGKQELEAHKKENPQMLPYNLVPSCEKLYRTRLEELKKLKDMKSALSAEYAKLRNNQIIAGKVVLLDCSKELRRVISRHYKDFIAVKTSNKDMNKNIAAVKEISNAEFIFIEQDNKFLDVLDIKDDTTVVYVPKYGFPFYKSEKATLAYKSGFFDEENRIAPVDKKVDCVVSGSKHYDDIYNESTGVDKSSVIHVGDIKSDCFYSKKFRKKAMEKLSSVCEIPESKKILLDFTVRDDRRPPDFESESDCYLYEYLKDDYLIIKYFTDMRADKSEEFLLTNEMRSYTKGIIDVTNAMSEYEAIAAADVIVGSFSNGFFASFASGKPVFAYAPYSRRRLHNLQTNFKYEAVMPCEIYTEADKLAQAVSNADKYDFTKLNKFKETFFENTDGKACERLLIKLGLIK